MIKTRTVFVLGAGASIPYGLHSGAELRKALYELGEHEGNVYAKRLRDKEFGYTQEELLRFSRAFRRSRMYSIDAFLTRRSDHEELGKLAIAAVLCDREDPETVVRSDPKEDWYSALWNAMATSDIGKVADITRNQMRFVTFNYDRSLEYALYLAINNTFLGASSAQAFAAVGELAILHVYGSLGEFCIEPREGGRQYVQSADTRGIRTAADAIRIIPEARKDDKAFDKAREWFNWAERICFLGFSFDPLNVERLGLNEVVDAKAQRGDVFRIYASVYDLTQAEVGAASHATCGGRNFIPGHPSWKALQTLREKGLL